MNKHRWSSQFANDPARDFELYLELIDGNAPQGKIERDADGELYLSLFVCPQVKIPFHWLLALEERARSLPSSGEEDTSV